MGHFGLLTYTWSTTKTHPDDANDDKRCGTTKKTKMPIRNDKIAINNNGVSKRHVGNIGWIKLDMELFFWVIGSTKMLKVKALKAMDTMFKDTKSTKKHIGDVTSIRVKNILHYIYFKNRGHWEAQYERHGGCWKSPKKLCLMQRKVPKRTSWMP